MEEEIMTDGLLLHVAVPVFPEWTLLDNTFIACG